MYVTGRDDMNQPKKEHVPPFGYSMMLPAFKGVDAVFGIEGLTNPRGCIIADKHQRNPKYKNLYPVACVAVPPRNANWFPAGKWVHSEPVYEKLILKPMGIEKLK